MRARGTRGGPGSSSAGFTLLESMIAIMVLGLVMTSATWVSSSSTSAYRTAASVRRIETRTHRAVRQVVAELAAANEATLNPNPVENLAYDALEYRSLDLVGAVAVPGPVHRLEALLEAGELDDGIDNNGNGLVDERILVMTRDVGGADPQRVVLCRDVAELSEGESFDGVDENGNGQIDEPGFHLERAGRVLTIRLTLQGVDPQGRLIEKTAETSTRMRN